MLPLQGDNRRGRVAFWDEACTQICLTRTAAQTRNVQGQPEPPSQAQNHLF